MNRQKVFRSMLSVAGALALWWLSSITLFNPILVPAPHKVAVNIWQMTADGEILFHAWASLRRVLVGYAFGSVLGILTGIAVARIRIAEDILEPPLQFVRNITPVAIIPMAVNAFGLEESSKYFVIIYSTIISVVFNTVAGVASTPPDSRPRGHVPGRGALGHLPARGAALGLAVHPHRDRNALAEQDAVLSVPQFEPLCRYLDLHIRDAENALQARAANMVERNR